SCKGLAAVWNLIYEPSPTHLHIIGSMQKIPLSCITIATARSSYHLTGGDLHRKAEMVFKGTPFSSPDLRKALLIAEGREITLVKDQAWDPKSSIWKRYQHIDKMECLAMGVLTHLTKLYENTEKKKMPYVSSM
uniref:Uncharacterized protein n=1 Tax=Falco tinnunculus TaxID=100819 RepID=A0A8C4UR20_FALTI